MSETKQILAVFDLIRQEQAKLLQSLTDPLGRVSIRGEELRFQLNMAITTALATYNDALLALSKEAK